MTLLVMFIKLDFVFGRRVVFAGGVGHRAEIDGCLGLHRAVSRVSEKLMLDPDSQFGLQTLELYTQGYHWRSPAPRSFVRQDFLTGT